MVGFGACVANIMGEFNQVIKEPHSIIVFELIIWDIFEQYNTGPFSEFSL